MKLKILGFAFLIGLATILGACEQGGGEGGGEGGGATTESPASPATEPADGAAPEGEGAAPEGEGAAEEKKEDKK